MVILFASKVQVPVNHHILLELQQPHTSRNRWKDHSDKHSAEYGCELDSEEQYDFLRMRPLVERVAGKNDHGSVGQHCKEAKHVEGCIPWLVVGAWLRHRATEEEDQLFLIEKALQDAADEAQHGYPWSCDNEKGAVTVQDKDLVHVLVQIIILFLGLLFCAGHVSHDRQGVGEKASVELAAFYHSPVPHHEVWHAELNQVLQGEANYDEDCQLPAKILQAIVLLKTGIVHAGHWHTEEV